MHFEINILLRIFCTVSGEKKNWTKIYPCLLWLCWNSCV